jgi:hypothetical protein
VLFGCFLCGLCVSAFQNFTCEAMQGVTLSSLLSITSLEIGRRRTSTGHVICLRFDLLIWTRLGEPHYGAVFQQTARAELLTGADVEGECDWRVWCRQAWDAPRNFRRSPTPIRS